MEKDDTKFFKPDIDLKNSLLYASNKSLVYLFNTIFNINLFQGSKFELLSTESVIDDFETRKNRIIMSDIIFKDIKTKQKYHIEFQSSKDNTMLLRVFTYSLEAAKKDYNIDNELLFPLSHIIYFTSGKEKYGEDKLKIVLPKFELDNIVYTDKTIKYFVGYTNLFKFTLEELMNSGFMLISYIYFYKYISDKRKINNDKKVKILCENLKYYRDLINTNTILHESDKYNIRKSLFSIIYDIKSFIDRKENISMETKEVLELEYKSIGDILEEEIKHKTELVLKFDLAKKMLKDGRADVTYISEMCDIDLDEVINLKNSL